MVEVEVGESIVVMMFVMMEEGMWSSKLFISMLTRTACSMQMHRACTPIRVYLLPTSVYIYI